MSIIDIRKSTPDIINRINFADDDPNYYVAKSIKISNADKVHILDGTREIWIKDGVDADNLIKALEKAKELGWFNK